MIQICSSEEGFQHLLSYRNGGSSFHRRAAFFVKKNQQPLLTNDNEKCTIWLKYVPLGRPFNICLSCAYNGSPSQRRAVFLTIWH